MVEINEVRPDRKYIFSLNVEGKSIEFEFDSIEEGSEFMFQAFEHAITNMKFVIDVIETF